MVTFTYNIFFDTLTTVLYTLYSFTYIYYYDIIYSSLFLIIFWNLIINKTFRAKFLYFFLVLGLVGGWGFYYSFDGLIMLFIIAELLIILLFLLLYLTITFELTQTLKTTKLFYIYYLLGIIIFFLPLYFTEFTALISYINIYQQLTDIISGDFFIFFCVMCLRCIITC